MATYELNVEPSIPDQAFQVVLENVTYRLRCRWNERAQSWYLDVSDDQGAIASGIPLVVRLPLLRRCVSTRRPPGELVCVDTTGADLEAGLADLGARVKLFYVESSA